MTPGKHQLADSVFHRFKRSRSEGIIFPNLFALSKRVFRDIG